MMSSQEKMTPVSKLKVCYSENMALDYNRPCWDIVHNEFLKGH